MVHLELDVAVVADVHLDDLHQEWKAADTLPATERAGGGSGGDEFGAWRWRITRCSAANPQISPVVHFASSWAGPRGRRLPACPFDRAGSASRGGGRGQVGVGLRIGDDAELDDVHADVGASSTEGAEPRLRALGGQIRDVVLVGPRRPQSPSARPRPAPWPGHRRPWTSRAGEAVHGHRALEVLPGGGPRKGVRGRARRRDDVVHGSTRSSAGKGGAEPSTMCWTASRWVRSAQTNASHGRGPGGRHLFELVPGRVRSGPRHPRDPRKGPRR